VDLEVTGEDHVGLEVAGEEVASAAGVEGPQEGVVEGFDAQKMGVWNDGVAFGVCGVMYEACKPQRGAPSMISLRSST